MKKKILFIIWSYSYGGGAEKILSNIVNNLNTDKYEISILEFYHAGLKKEYTNENIHILKPIIDSKKTPSIMRKFYNFNIYFCPSILRKKILNEYDLQIAFNYQIPTFLLNKNVKNICWVHGAPLDLKKHYIKRIKQFGTFKNTNNIIAISELTKKSIIEIFPKFKKKVKLINNGYDFSSIKQLSLEKTEILLEENSLIFCGRISTAKNPVDLIRVVKIVKDLGMDIHLYLLGDGNQKEKIFQISKDLNVESNIHLLGYIDNPYPLIKQAKMMCMLSKSEGFPTVFVESMILGVPFISSYVGGCEELSQDGNCGIIVDSVEECGKEIFNLLNDNKRYCHMKENCIKHVEKYTLDLQIEKIERLFDNVLGSQK